MEQKKYIPLKELEVYNLSRQLSIIAWGIYDSQTWQDKKTIGDQFIRSTDSVGANIAEGYHRYHYLDKVKYYFYSRASLAECNIHWLELLLERGKITELKYKEFNEIAKSLEVKLNNFIKTTYNQSKKYKK